MMLGTWQFYKMHGLTWLPLCYVLLFEFSNSHGQNRSNSVLQNATTNSSMHSSHEINCIENHPAILQKQISYNEVDTL
jgi:hypothetical protein